MKGTLTITTAEGTYTLEVVDVRYAAGRVHDAVIVDFSVPPEPVWIPLEVSPERVRAFWERWEKSLRFSVPTERPQLERQRRAQWKQERNRYGPRRR